MKMSEETIRLIDGIEIEEGERLFYCDGCGKAGNKKHFSSGAVSIKHKHHTAYKCQKSIKVIMEFKDLQDDDVTLCEKCRGLIIQGMYVGEMWE